jgi:hypothetical protein
MYSGDKTCSGQIDSLARIQTLKRWLLSIALFNLFLVALIGLVLRGFPLFSYGGINYHFLLHGHSHFAFGGWIMPVLLWLIISYFPEVCYRIGYRHWRNITLTILISAYGMLLSFPVQGYAPVSIGFSTISVIAGFYMAILLWKATKRESNTSSKFLRAGLFYFVLSSLGPFATGPLVALGKTGSVLYADVIYFYLHFQYNGWFSFAIFSLLYALMEKAGGGKRGNKAFLLFQYGCAPSYFLSTLWSHPPLIFYIAGGIGALLQLIGIYYLLLDAVRMKESHRFLKGLMRLGFAALAFKCFLQLLSAFPFIADLAYGARNFIIAYLHLVLLGFISLFAFGLILHIKRELLNKGFTMALQLFIFSLVTTESLLVLQAFSSYFNFELPHYQAWLFSFSCFFPLAAFLAWFFPVAQRLNKKKAKTTPFLAAIQQ